jgi:hypothetical protein
MKELSATDSLQLVFRVIKTRDAAQQTKILEAYTKVFELLSSFDEDSRAGVLEILMETFRLIQKNATNEEVPP